MFLKTKQLPKPEPQAAVVKFPNGTFIESTNGEFFYIKNDVRIRIPDTSILASWRVVNIPLFNEDSLKHYPISGNLPYRDGTLLQNQADKSADWYVSGGRVRRIDNPLWYQWLNININDIIVVSKYVFDLHKMGEPLS